MGLLSQGSYPTISADQGPPPEPRLFLISDKIPGGVEEIADFSQNDLNPDDAFLLDAYYAVSAILADPLCLLQCTIASLPFLSFLFGCKSEWLTVCDGVPSGIWDSKGSVCGGVLSVVRHTRRP